MMPTSQASAALKRFIVLDLTRVRSGPTAVRQLADWGASVIKVERPAAAEQGEAPGGPRNGADFMNLHRNKRSLTLDLKSPAGLAVFKRLAAKADVVVENFRPDVKDRLGIAYGDLRAINPRLVYGSISGFGQVGPYAKRPRFDQIAQGMDGLMSVTGLPSQGPVRPGIPIAALCARLFCAMGSIGEMFADPQVRHFGIAGKVADADMMLMAQPFTLSRTPSNLDRRSPGRGADSEEVLQELGSSVDEISVLRAGNTI